MLPIPKVDLKLSRTIIGTGLLTSSISLNRPYKGIPPLPHWRSHLAPSGKNNGKF